MELNICMCSRFGKIAFHLISEKSPLTLGKKTELENQDLLMEAMFIYYRNSIYLEIPQRYSCYLNNAMTQRHWIFVGFFLIWLVFH